MLLVESNGPGSHVEKRAHYRIDMVLNSSIKLKNGIEHQGVTRNISYSGAFFAVENPLQVTKGEYCVFALYSDLDYGVQEVKLKCKIVDVRDDGIALEFRAINKEEYFNFVFLLAERFPTHINLMNQIKQESIITIS